MDTIIDLPVIHELPDQALFRSNFSSMETDLINPLNYNIFDVKNANLSILMPYLTNEDVGIGRLDYIDLDKVKSSMQLTLYESSKNISAMLADKKEDIGTAHLFKSYNRITYDEVVDRDSYGLNYLINKYKHVGAGYLFDRFRHYAFLRRESQVAIKTDIVINEYILKSYISSGVYLRSPFDLDLTIKTLCENRERRVT